MRIDAIPIQKIILRVWGERKARGSQMAIKTNKIPNNTGK